MSGSKRQQKDKNEIMCCDLCHIINDYCGLSSKLINNVHKVTNFYFRR